MSESLGRAAAVLIAVNERLRNERGQTAGEYVGVVLLIVAVVAAFGTAGPARGVARAIGEVVAGALATIGDGGEVAGGGGGPASDVGLPEGFDAAAAVAPAALGVNPRSLLDPYDAGDRLPPGVERIDAPPVAPLSPENRMKPWVRVGMSEEEWRELENEVADEVCEGGLLGVLVGCSFFGLNIDEEGRLYAIELQEMGIGSALSRGARLALRARPPPSFATALRNVSTRIPLALKDRLIAAGVLRSPASSLPRYAGGKTEGILDVGSRQSSLISGYSGPAAQIPRGTRGFDLIFRSHVEGHAAAIMRREGIRRATLYINQNPCRVCLARLPRALPEGYELRVIGPNGSGFLFRGVP